MRCLKCEKQLKLVTKPSICVVSKIIGEIFVKNIQAFECNSSTCDTLYWTPESSRKISNSIRIYEEIAIANLPIGDFVSASSAAEYLEITKQAFSTKFAKFRNLFMHRMIDDRAFFYIPSLAMYKKCGDGRLRVTSGIYSTECISADPEIEITEMSDGISMYSELTADGANLQSPSLYVDHGKYLPQGGCLAS